MRERERETEGKDEGEVEVEKEKRKTSIEAHLAHEKSERFRPLALFAGARKRRVVLLWLLRSRSRGHRRLCSTARACEKSTREAERDSGEGAQNKKAEAPKSAHPIAAAAGTKKERPPSPFLSLTRSRQYPTAAYLVLGLGSQPFEERVALIGAGCARLVLVSHRFSFFLFRFVFSICSIPFFFAAGARKEEEH